MDFTQLKEEIKAGKYLPEHNTALPQLPENANEEAIRINDQYKQHIELLKLRINTLEAQSKRVDVQKKLDIQWQEEAEKRETEINNLVDEYELLQAMYINQENTIKSLKEKLTDAKNLAAENATGKNKQLTAEVEKLKKQLEENQNTNKVEWDVFFNVFKENVNSEETNIVSSYLMDVISKASPTNALELISRLSNLKREIRENSKKTTDIKVSGDYIMTKNVENEVNNVEPNATGIAVSKQN
jgi:DNA repair exonuclease SbcCD ATPase subunit